MPGLSDAQRIAWLRLIRSENVGPRTFRNLVNHFGGAAAALEALPDLARRGGRTIHVCSTAEAEDELAECARRGVRMIALGEPDYPAILASTEGAPPLLAVAGAAGCFKRPMVSIVGARNASSAGRSFAQRLAHELGGAGWVVVSGLARGIDAAAHAASVETGTVAVFAGGLDCLYPPEHADLASRIVEDGALVSEMPMGWQPRGRDFPRRNRIIAAMSLGVVVVEAAMRSGSLITARLATEIGREVMAAPGSPLDPRCEGSNALLREGATLITRSEHVIEALGPLIDRGPPPPPPISLAQAGAAGFETPAAADDDRTKVLELLGPSPATIDDLVRQSGAQPRIVQVVLLELELAGRLDRREDGRVALRSVDAFV
ncbi:DNA-processing protein DprA [Chenggangzhangella methanolivorans]|uniref:DNA-processing protein DprA n=1 Tax=Chenggangzhangella methanolivorans TaxID=1437009 RepID=A0A9E6R9D8_9HYPH|nr:DNA-processing protein DprA [Chenggangzhangella methanolivorans]QZN99951.1 DNA-processing protein DprA [Chenggangzhangella methanolivorans]